MINRSDLLKDLQRELPKIEKDILEYSEYKEGLAEHLQEEYEKAQAAGRTAEHFVAWREAQITQAAVAWLLTCVFVRFLEDNNLLVEPMLSGPAFSNQDGKETKPLQHAKERIVAFFNENPTLEERDYLLDLFAQLERFPVIAELLDHRHNPLWQIPVSSDGAKALIDFFQKIDADTGEIIHDFTDSDWDTRFLGDLYQDLSESVRKRYALLQTPEFVESFILDYTLEKAIDTFGLTHGKPDSLRLIDPTCGSGHFLLTTFERMFDAWQKREPGTNTRELAQRALDVVHGVDINPYAIAICRFRLLIAGMKVAGSSKIKEAPNFQFNLACGDSLLHGRRFEWEGQGHQQDIMDEKSHVYEMEDQAKLDQILGRRYHVVVGNPPYITVKDKALNQAYRNKYPTCHRKYSLGAPFTERFFDLTLWPEDNSPAGFMGMITANSFMKREFGKKLIEDYLSRKDLTHVIDTSGAYIPGHGTPTVIMFARNQAPKSEQIQAVLGIRGEPGTPDIPAQGKVWSSIVQLLPKRDAESDYVTVVRQKRSSYSEHPWSLGGGGASELKKLVEHNRRMLESKVDVIGFGAILGEDEAFGVPSEKVTSVNFPACQRPLVEGDKVRDWNLQPATTVLFPYSPKIEFCIDESQTQYLWPLRTNLWARNTFGKHTYRNAGRHYAEYHQIPRERNKLPLSITFAFVSTHNHFVLDRGGKVFKQSAPVIKLPTGATESEHFALLGLLNSSVGMFWMRQVFHGKGQGGVGQESRAEWEEFREFTGTGLKKFPVADDSSRLVTQFAEKMDRLARELSGYDPESWLPDVAGNLDDLIELNRMNEQSLWQQMVALQEELDWHTYYLYGLTESRFCFEGELPLISPGERTFEIALARKIASGDIESTWFSRHGSKPITEIPQCWPEDYRQLVEQRLAMIENNRWIKLVEQPEYKRRWNRDSWEERLKTATKQWLLNRCEQLAHAQQLQTCAQLADRLSKFVDADQVAAIYTGSDMVDWQALVSELVARDQVPQIAAARLKPAAMVKWQAWQETWNKQRAEDAIDVKYGIDKPLSTEDTEEAEKQYEQAKQQAANEKQQSIGAFPVPPAYKQPDFRQASFWSLRGKLDVPKERFFSLPGCEKDGDSTLVIGWAGMNHLQRATAIATWYLDRKETDGWEAEKLKPMLVALDELIPWLKQWHNDIDPEFGERMGDYYEGFLLEEMRMLDVTKDDLLAWEPPAAPKKKVAKKKTTAKKAKPKRASAEVNDTNTSKEQG